MKQANLNASHDDANRLKPKSLQRIQKYYYCRPRFVRQYELTKFKTNELSSGNGNSCNPIVGDFKVITKETGCIGFSSLMNWERAWGISFSGNISPL